MHRVLPLFLILVAACGGSGAAVNITDPQAPQSDVGPVDHSAYEMFDIGAYPDQPVARPVELEHDVPSALMQNKADEGVRRTQSGYRVQVLATLDPQEAEQMEARLREWWLRRAELLTPGTQVKSEQKVYRLFRQPYYRIRIGDFVSRARAEEFLAIVSASFDGAFIVPDRVTVTR